jgi:type IV secretory pathway TrbF-like protein
MAAQSLSAEWEDEQIRIHNRQLWRVTVASIAANVIFAIALTIQTLGSRTLPYVVMVDTKGEPVTVAQPVVGTASLNDATKRWAISQFIRNARTVTANVDEEKENLANLMAFARQQAAVALKAYYNDDDQVHSPFKIAKKSWVEVNDIRVLRLPVPDTYQVDWAETRNDYNRHNSVTSNWRATLTVVAGQPNGRDQRNPLSLYVSSLDWAPEGVSQ